ncbi:unnamed protein product [Rhizoctonia solani]|uniref:Uncharacterized protein n=1 Tax=Rhizoctonia solani TaxID=456999 RepID=A0A8H3BGS8_9AGAM|nr:unnamed protein product [Rhizoctonia solani]
MIDDDKGDRPQLVHIQDYVGKPSRLVRFAARLRLTSRDKALMDAWEKPISLYSKIINQEMNLAVESQSNVDTDSNMRAVKVLAEHLYEGTRPGRLPKNKFGNKGEQTKQIPIQ